MAKKSKQSQRKGLTLNTSLRCRSIFNSIVEKSAIKNEVFKEEQVRWLSMYTSKTPSDSTLESCMPSTERSRVCFGEFAIFCLVEIILYFLSLLDAFSFYFPSLTSILRQCQV